MRIGPAIGVLAFTLLTLAPTAAAQVPAGLGEGWKGEFEHAASQLTQLAETIPADKFGWRPAPGVRSIAELCMHVAIGNYFLLREAGAKPTVDLSKLGKEPEKGITDKDGVIKFMKESFEAVRTAAPAVDRTAPRKFFGKDVTSNDVLLRLLVHNHEHMGQLIAYARMNGVVPPWTAARGQ
jgi:uncharacterized damage-inducible protein DinB